MTRGKRKQLIINAAKQLIRTAGPERLTIDEITKLAGTGKGTMYLYFKSKDEILNEIVGEYLDKVLVEIRQCKSLQTESPIENLREVLSVHLSHLHALIMEGGMSHDTLEEIRSHHCLVKKFGQFYGDTIDVIKEILTEGSSKGIFNIDDVEIASVIIVSTIGNSIWELVKTHDFETILNSYLGVFLRGILI